MAFWNKKKQEKPKLQHQDDDWEFKQHGRTEFHGPKGTRVGEDLDEGLNRINREQQAEAARQAKLDAKEAKRQEAEAKKANVGTRPVKVDKLSYWEKRELDRDLKQLPQAAPKSVYDDLETERKARLAAEDNFRQEKAAREASGKKYQEDLKKGVPPQPTKEDILSRLNPKDRKKFEKEYAQSQSDKAKAEYENWKYGIPSTGPTRYTREWVNSFTVQKGQTYKDPQSGKEYTEGQTVPGHHLIIPIPGEPLSGLEQTQMRQTAELNQLQLQSLRGQARHAEAERRYGWVRDVGLGTMSAVAQGVGSAGNVIRQGGGPRGQLSMAQRNFSPSPNAGQNPIYQINRPAAPIIRQPTPQFNPNGQSLAHLRNIQIVRNQNLNPVPQNRTSLMQTRAPSTAQGFRGNLPNVTAKHGIMAKKMGLW